MTTQPAGAQQPAPLAISCTRADCVNDLHCFKRTRKMAPDRVGTCRSCGADLIDWKRVQKRDHTDVGYVFTALKCEWIRHHCWHAPIDEEATLHARRKGRIRLKADVLKRLRKSVGP